MKYFDLTKSSCFPKKSSEKYSSGRKVWGINYMYRGVMHSYSTFAHFKDILGANIFEDNQLRLF